MRKGTLGFWSFLLVLTVLLVACAPAAAPAPTATTPPATAKPAAAATQAVPATTPQQAAPTAAAKATGEPYKLGILAASTGPASWLGQPTLKGTKLRVDQINAAGGINGRPVATVEYDTTANPELAVTNFTKLVEKDGVVAIIGPNVTAECAGVATQVARAGIPTYCMSSGLKPDPKTANYAGQVYYENVFNFMFSYIQKQGIKKLATIALSDASGQVGVDISKKLGQQLGIEVVAESFNAGDADVTPQLTRLRAGNPQAVLVNASGAGAATAVKALKQLGFDVPVYAPNSNLSGVFLQLVQGSEPKVLLMPGGRITDWQAFPDSDPAKPVMKQFMQDYQAKYNEAGDIYAAAAYDGADVFLKALKAVGPDPKKMVEWTDTNIKNYIGASAFIDLSPTDHNGQTDKSLAMFQVSGGKFVLAK